MNALDNKSKALLIIYSLVLKYCISLYKFYWFQDKLYICEQRFWCLAYYNIMQLLVTMSTVCAWLLE